MDQKMPLSGIAGFDRTSIDAGLRAHMQRVYGYMAGGLVLTGLVSFVCANTAIAGVLYGTPLRWLAVLCPLAFILFMNAKMATMQTGTLRTLFWSFCAAMGLSMGTLFLLYSGESIARTFFITAGTFGAMSLYGYTTMRDLTGMGSFFLMGVIGLMIACVVNLFLVSSMLQFGISVLGVLIFTGLAAYDTQRIKETYSSAWSPDANAKLAIAGALSLYLNFINLFQFMLSLTGGRRN